MIPNNQLSSVAIVNNYLPPNTELYRPTESASLGGDSLGDSGDNLVTKTWLAKYNSDTNEVTIESDTDAPELLFVRPDITEISLSYDQNMRPTVAFMEDGVATLWWYDSQVSDQVFTQYPDATDPRVILDDRRPWAIGDSDNLLFYVKNDNLYMRIQRERFQDEHLLKENLNGQRLWRVSTNNSLRIMFEFGERRPVKLDAFIPDTPSTIR